MAVALVVRLSAVAWWQARHGEQFVFGDSYSYWALGQAIAAGEPYQYGTPDARVFRTPGYPLVLAAVFRIGGADVSAFWARAVGAVLGTAAVGLTYLLARRLFDPRVGIVAAALASVYPGAVAMSIFVLAEAAFCPLLIAQLIAWVASHQSTASGSRLGWSAVAGALAALATLVRPSWLLFTPLAIAVSWAIGPNRWQRAGQGAWMLAAMLVVMSPWWVRNWHVTGHFVPTTLQAGASLYDGLNPVADGSSDMAFVGRFIAEERREDAWATEPFEYRLDRRMRRAALDWAADHPAEVWRLAAVKFGRMWNLWPNDPEFRGAGLQTVVAISYVPIMLAGLYGVWRFALWRWPVALCWLPAAYLTLLHVIFVSSIRYREPAMFGMLVLAAAAITTAARHRGEKTAA